MNADIEGSFLNLVTARLITSAFSQPLEYLKIVKQTGYSSSSSSSSTSFLQQRMSKLYTSVYQHQPDAIFKGLTLTMIQQSIFAVNLYKLYPFLVTYYGSINDNNLYNAELYAAATSGFIHGLVSTPFETVKMRQIGNTLMKNSTQDLKIEMSKPYVVKEFLFDPVQNSSIKQRQSDLSEIKRVNALCKTIPKENLFSYTSFEKLMGLNPSTDQPILEQMKKNKLLADKVYTNPATKIIETIKEMMTTNPSIYKNFTNAACLTAIQTSIQTTSFVFSLHKIQQLTHYALTTESDSYYAQFLQSFILAKQNDKFFSQIAPMLIGVPSAFITCILTQPIDNIKTVLQSGQFDKFRQLSDSKQITFSRPNIAEVLVKCYISNNNLKGLYSGFNLRFLRLSFWHTGFGYGITKELFGVWNKYSEMRKLQS